MDKFLKENLLLLVLPVFVIIMCVYGVGKIAAQAVTNYKDVMQKQEQVSEKQSQLQKITQKKLMKSQQKTEVKNGKVIYEVLGNQFTPEASFGVMFENVLANITNSGVRIRMIQYNYQPMDDKILLTGTPGYNACEMFFTAVGSYSQLQTFFKSLTKENYLTNIYEVYIEPYDLDQNILIAKFKVRLYTKTI